MIDIVAILFFGLLVVYTVFRAIRLDSLIPWFSADSAQQSEQKKQR